MISALLAAITLAAAPAPAGGFQIPCGDESIEPPGLEYLVDAGRSMTINEASRARFEPLRGGFLKSGYTTAAIWVRFTAHNRCGADRFLEIPELNTDSLRFYRMEDGRVIHEAKETGDGFPYSTREIDHRRFLFRIPPGQRPTTHYLRIESSTYITFPLILLSRDALDRSETLRLALIWFFIGLMTVFSLYNLVFFIAIRDREHLSYFLLTAAYAMNVVSWQGIGLRYLWPGNNGWGHLMHTLSASLAGLTLMLFSRDYLDLKENSRHISRLVLLACAVIAANFIALFFFESRALYYPMYAVTLLASIGIAGYSLYASLRGSRPALFFFVSYLMALASYTVFILYVWGAVDAPLLVQWLIPAGEVAQISLLSIGLSSKIRVMMSDLEALTRRIQDKPDSVTSATEEKLRDAITFIGDNYRCDISREGLAARYGMNTDYFSRAFKIYAGKKIGDYINGLRVEEASRLLAGSDGSVIDIAYAVGYENLRTFNRAFLRETGMSPSEYRKSPPSE